MVESLYWLQSTIYLVIDFFVFYGVFVLFCFSLCQLWSMCSSIILHLKELAAGMKPQLCCSSLTVKSY